ncbi:MAG TPA: FliH/SctL family protein [Jatrophihabitans sp.]|nr:FliH/SctL family protein [Jatrophihabitans sp.]
MSSFHSRLDGEYEPAGAGFELAGAARSELVDQAQVQARAVGYAQGWTQGIREAAASQAAEADRVRAEREAAGRRQADEVAAAVRALLAAADRLGQAELRITDELSDRMLAAAVELAGVLVGEHLADPERSATSVLRRVLGQLPAEQPVTIRLSAADHATLTGESGARLLADVDPMAAARVSFELDPTLAPGDALARAAATTVDARISTAFDRLRGYAR